MTTTYIFGQRFNVPAFDDATVLTTPVGQLCLMCGEKVETGDSGVFMPALMSEKNRVSLEPEHIECHLRSVLGSVEHMDGHCTCGDGTAEDSLSYRESARQVMAWLDRQDRPASLIDY